MTTMTRFVPLRSPLQDVAQLQNRLNSIFSEFVAPTEPGASSTGSFVPAVDIYEDAQSLVLKLEVPGLKPEDIDIRMENQSLTIKGERRFEAREKAENFHRIERRFGTFARSFTLPQTVDTENVSAAYDAGVLQISLAKKPEAKPKQVKVEIGGQSSSQSGNQSNAAKTMDANATA